MIRKWWRSLALQKADLVAFLARKRGGRGRRPRLVFDLLEDRTVPAVDITAFNVAAGTVTFTGDSGGPSADQLALSEDGGFLAHNLLVIGGTGDYASDTDVDPGPGVASIAIGSGTAPLVTVNLQTLDDSLTFDDSWTFTHPVSFDGGTDGNTLVSNDGDDTFVLSSASSGTLNGTVSFSNVQTLDGSGFTTANTVFGANIANTWTITSGTTATYNGTLSLNDMTVLEGGSDADTFDIAADVLEPLTLDGNDGNDSFNFTDGVTFLSNSLDGGAGTDTLNYSAWTAGTITELTSTGSTDGFAGAEFLSATNFDNIDELDGSATSNDDILFGLTDGGTFDIDGTDTYTSTNVLTLTGDNTLSGLGTGADTFNLSTTHTGDLIGDDGADAFHFIGSAQLVGGVYGDAGNDTLDYSSYATPISAVLTGSLATGYTGTEASSITGGFNGIDVLTGTAATTDSLQGEDVVSTWNVSNTSTYDDLAGNGTLTFTSIDTLQGGSQNDTFNVAPLTDHAITINGGAPTVAVGDTLNMDLTGTTGAALSLLGPGAGKWTFNAPHKSVTYASIETTTTTGASYDLTLDMAAAGFQNGVGDYIEARLKTGDPTRFQIFVGSTVPVSPLFFEDNFANVLSFHVIGSTDAEGFIVNSVNGRPIPVNGIAFDGNAGIDRLQLTSAAADAVVYTPSAATLGSGTVTQNNGVDTKAVTFTGLGLANEGVDITGVNSATLQTPNGNDTVAVNDGKEFLRVSPLVPSDAVRFTGTSGGVAFTPLAVWSNTTVTLDAVTNDTVANNTDAVTVTTATKALTNLTISTAAPADGSKSAADQVTLGTVSASGTVNVSTGKIVDDGNQATRVTADVLQIRTTRSGDAVGTSGNGDIDFNANQLSVNSGGLGLANGNMYLNELDTVTVTQLEAGTGSSANTSKISLTGGTFFLGASGVVSDASEVAVSATATFDLNNFTERIGSLSGAGSVKITDSAPPSVTLYTGAGNNPTTTFSGVISGAGDLTKEGTGTFTLSGNNTLQGTTHLVAGTLKVDGTFNASSALVQLEQPGVTLTGQGTINRGVAATATSANTTTGSTIIGSATTAGNGLTIRNPGGTALLVNHATGVLSVGSAAAGKAVILRDSVDGMLITQGTQAHTGGEGLIVRSNSVGVDAESGCVQIQQSTFGGASGQGNGTALYMSAASIANFVVQLSNISWNTIGAQNNSSTLSISAILDWWGNAAGPGPVDGAGRNPVVGLVDYIPFATGSNVTTFASGVLVVGGNIYVVGTNNADNITVTIATGTSPLVKVQFGTTTLGTYTLGPDQTQNRVVIYGLDGNDTIRVVGTRNAEIHGGDGNDTITGGSGTDVIYGEGGDDTLDGGAGNDVLIGGDGRDTLIGNSGDNIMMAGDLGCFMVFNGPGGPRRYDFTTMQQIVAAWSAMGGGDPSGNASTAELQSDALAGFIGDSTGDSMSNGTGKGWFICQATDTVTTSITAPNWRTNTP